MRSLDQVPGWIRPVHDASPLEKAAAAFYAAARLSGSALVAIRRWRPDVIYVPSAELLPSLLAGVLASRNASVPLVACATTIVSWQTQSRVDILRTAARRLLHLAKAVIVLDNAVAEKLRHEGFSAPTFVGLTGVDRSSVPAVSNPSRRVLFLSRVVPEKGVFDSVDAFAHAVRADPNAFLEIRGHGPARVHMKLKRLADRLGVMGRIRLLGPVPSDADKWRLLSDSISFIAPSYIEHFGIAVREALSAGLPTVVYALPPFADIRDHPSLIEAPLGDVRTLGEALRGALAMTANHRAGLLADGRSHSVGPTWSDAADREFEILAGCTH